MPRRPDRMRDIVSIGVERMGDLADGSRSGLLRLENLDVDIAPCAAAIERTRAAASCDSDNSYLPFLGQRRLRQVAAEHVARTAGVLYDESNCIIAPGGLAGILNVLLATLDVADEVVVTDPTYAGLLNRIRLAGGVPKFAPFAFTPQDHWRLDQDALRNAIGPRTRAMLLMSPSMPSGGLLSEEDWRLVSQLCCTHDLLLIVDAAMERLVYEGRPVIHPAGFAGMRERTVTVGSASKELRMIGWRVGWIVGPQQYMPDIAAVSIANCVVPVGIAQDAVAIAPRGLAHNDARLRVGARTAARSAPRRTERAAVRGARRRMVHAAAGQRLRARRRSDVATAARSRHRGNQHARLGRDSRGAVHPLRLLQRTIGSLAWRWRQGQACARLLDTPCRCLAKRTTSATHPDLDQPVPVLRPKRLSMQPHEGTPTHMVGDASTLSDSLGLVERPVIPR